MPAVRIREITVNVDFASNALQWGPTDLQNRIGTASFVYEALQNPLTPFLPQVGDPVRIVDYAALTTLFFGHIAQMERGGDPIGKRYVLHCQDLNALFDKIRLPVDFTYAAGLHDKAIVDDLLFTDAGGRWGAALPYLTIGLRGPDGVLGSGSVGASKCAGLPAVTLKAGLSLAQACDQLSALVGGVSWYVGHATNSLWTDGPRLFHWNDLGTVAPLVLTTNNPDTWPNAANYFYNYSEFIDRTGHFHRVTVDNGAGISATATDWAAWGAAAMVQLREYQSPNPPPGHPGDERILEGPRVTDSTLTTQAQVTQRAWQELRKGRIRRTINLTYDRATSTGNAPIVVGMLVDIVHSVWTAVDEQYWGGVPDAVADTAPSADLSREVGAHSNIRGELVPGCRARYMVQKVTPRLRASGNPALYSYDLQLGDYEDDLVSFLVRAV